MLAQVYACAFNPVDDAMVAFVPNDGTALVIFQVMWPLIQLPMAPPPDPAEVAWMFLFKAVVGAA